MTLSYLYTCFRTTALKVGIVSSTDRLTSTGYERRRRPSWLEMTNEDSNVDIRQSQNVKPLNKLIHRLRIHTIRYRLNVNMPPENKVAKVTKGTVANTLSRLGARLPPRHPSRAIGKAVACLKPRAACRAAQRLLAYQT